MKTKTSKRMKKGFSVLWSKTKKGYANLANSKFVKNQRAISKHGNEGFEMDFGNLGGTSKKSRRDDYQWSTEF
jgi:hypothetical protein